MNKPVGLYIHVPFCVKKCPYCDFYSLPVSEELLDAYTKELLRRISGLPRVCADTVYFGGGTPDLLGGERLSKILEAVRKYLSLSADAEITVEANPGDALAKFLAEAKAAGVNRVSLGMQSASDAELRLLGRRHDFSMTKQAVRALRETGIENFSLDLMVGVEGQTEESMLLSADACAGFGAKHVSAYLLKIEKGTPFFLKKETMELPGDDEIANRYLSLCERLEKNGYPQYEISNFAQPGYESRHNLKYWRDEEYLGLGPAAHSFYGGKRFFEERSLTAFLQGKPQIPDGNGGDPAEYLMLALRLSEGVRREACAQRYGEALFEKLYSASEALCAHGLAQRNENSVRLTQKGFLVSNSAIFSLEKSLGLQ